MKELSKSTIQKCKEELDEVKKEISKIVVGQEKIVEILLNALLANGHVLLEGIPGIAKTLVIRSLAAATGLPNNDTA